MPGNAEFDPQYDDYPSDEYPPDWQARRRRVLERDGYRCRNCGVRSTRVDEVYFDVDHVVPKSEGGTHALSNLQALCPACHARKHPGNEALARRARGWENRNATPAWHRVLRVVLVVPLLLGWLSESDTSRNGGRVVTDDFGRELEVTPVAAIDGTEEGRGVTVEARVATLWETSSESIHQVGLLAPADSTRSDDVPLVKFVSWADSDLPTVEADATYRLVGAQTRLYDGDVELSLDSLTEILRLE